MANPFTYFELHTTDADRAKTFYTELFGWKTKDTMVPGSAHRGLREGAVTRAQPRA